MSFPTQPKRLTNYLERRIETIKEFIDALRGVVFVWGSDEHRIKGAILAEMGIHLVTKTGAQKQGYELRKRAKRIGRAYYTAPIRKYCDLYVLEMHFTETPKGYARRSREMRIDWRFTSRTHGLREEIAKEIDKEIAEGGAK